MREGSEEIVMRQAAALRTSIEAYVLIWNQCGWLKIRYNVLVLPNEKVAARIHQRHTARKGARPDKGVSEVILRQSLMIRLLDRS